MGVLIFIVLYFLIDFGIHLRVYRSMFMSFFKIGDRKRIFAIALKDMSLRWITVRQRANLYFFLVSHTDQREKNEMEYLMGKTISILSKGSKLSQNRVFLMGAALIYYRFFLINSKSIDDSKKQFLFTQAESYYAKSKLAPDSNKGFIGLVFRFNALLEVKRFHDIVNYFEEELDKNLDLFNRKKIPVLLYYKARALIHLNEYKKAYEIYKMINKNFSINNKLHHPYLFIIYRDMGKCLEVSGKYRESLEHYQDALKLLRQMDEENKLTVQLKLLKTIKEIEKKLPVNY